MTERNDVKMKTLTLSETQKNLFLDGTLYPN